MMFNVNLNTFLMNKRLYLFKRYLSIVYLHVNYNKSSIL
jgi:hypothetical protein